MDDVTRKQQARFVTISWQFAAMSTDRYLAGLSISLSRKDWKLGWTVTRCCPASSWLVGTRWRMFSSSRSSAWLTSSTPPAGMSGYPWRSWPISVWKYSSSMLTTSRLPTSPLTSTPRQTSSPAPSRHPGVSSSSTVWWGSAGQPRCWLQP